MNCVTSEFRAWFDVNFATAHFDSPAVSRYTNRFAQRSFNSGKQSMRADAVLCARGVSIDRESGDQRAKHAIGFKWLPC
jgi:hypothetical protein